LSAVCKLEGIFEGTLSLYLQEEEASRSARLEGSSEDEVGLCRSLMHKKRDRSQQAAKSSVELNQMELFQSDMSDRLVPGMPCP
jgi:hypothetical protein